MIGGVEYDANGVPSLVFKPAPPPPPKPKPPAVNVPYELTDHVRFDLPGRYRLYIADEVTDGRGAPVISNILEIEITPRDVAWENETLRWAVSVLDLLQLC